MSPYSAVIGVKDMERRRPNIEIISFGIIAFVSAALPLILFKTIEMCHINGQTYANDDLYYGSKALILNIVIPIMLLIFLRYFRTNKSSLKTSGILFFFVVWAFISALASPYRMNSLFGWPFRWQGAVTYFMYFVLFSFTLTFLKPDRIKLLLVIVYASAVLIALYGILEYYKIEPLKGLFLDYFGNDLIDGAVRSTIGNRNFFGSYMTMLSLTAIFSFLTESRKLQQRCFFLLSVLFIAGVVASLTRGVWLGFLGAFIVMVFLLKDRLMEIRLKLLLVMAAGLIIIAVMNMSGFETPSTRIENTANDIREAKSGDAGQLGSGRIYIYTRTLKVFLNKPILGTGPDNLAYYLPLTKEESKHRFGNDRTICIDKAHSEYLEYAATMGLPGLILYLCFIVSILLPAIKNRKQFEPASWGILSGIIGYLLQATFNIGVISVLPLFFIYLALLKLMTLEVSIANRSS